MASKHASNNKLLAINSAVSMVRMILSIFVMLFVSRVIFRELGESDFGIYQVIGGFVTLIAFVNEAMSVASQRYLSYAIGLKNEKLLNATFSISVFIHIAIAVAVVLASEITGIYYIEHWMKFPPERIEAVKTVFHFVVASFSCGILMIPAMAWLNAKENIVALSIFGVIESLLKLALAIAIIWLGNDKLIFYGVGMMLIGLVTLLIHWGYCFAKYNDFRISFAVKRSLLREITSFASWTLSGSIAWVSRTQGNAMILNHYFGAILNSIYGLSNQVSVQISNFAIVMTKAFNPQIVKSYAEGDKERMHTLILNATRYSFLIVYFFLLPIWFELDMVLTLWLGEYPEGMIPFCRLILIMSLLQAAMQPIESAIHASGKIMVHSIFVFILSFVCLILSVILFRYGYKAETLVWLNILLNVVFGIFRLVYLKKVVRLSIRDFAQRVIVPLSVVLIITVPLMFALQTIFTDAIVRFLLGSILTFFFCAAMGLNKPEVAMLKEKLLNMLIKFNLIQL